MVLLELRVSLLVAGPRAQQRPEEAPAPGPQEGGPAQARVVQQRLARQLVAQATAVAATMGWIDPHASRPGAPRSSSGPGPGLEPVGGGVGVGRRDAAHEARDEGPEDGQAGAEDGRVELRQGPERRRDVGEGRVGRGGAAAEGGDADGGDDADAVWVFFPVSGARQSVDQ